MNTRNAHIDRRGFLATISAALIGATLDVDRLLWVPGTKLISVPKPQPYRGLIYLNGVLLRHGVDFVFTGKKIDLIQPPQRGDTITELRFQSRYQSNPDYFSIYRCITSTVL